MSHRKRQQLGLRRSGPCAPYEHGLQRPTIAEAGRRHTPMQCSHAVGIRRCSAATPSAYADPGIHARADPSLRRRRQRVHPRSVQGSDAIKPHRCCLIPMCAECVQAAAKLAMGCASVHACVRAGACVRACVRACACVRVRGLVYPRSVVRHHRAPRYTTRHGMPQGKCRPVVPPAHRGAISIGVTIASHSVRSNAQPCHCTPDRCGMESNGFRARPMRLS
jgi:hypothetical protein